MPICCARFERHRGKMYSRRLYPYRGLQMNSRLYQPTYFRSWYILSRFKKSISSLVTKMYQLQDQKSRHKAFYFVNLKNKKILNLTYISHCRRKYFFRIISSSDESVILLPGKVCTENFLSLLLLLFSFYSK